MGYLLNGINFDNKDDYIIARRGFDKFSSDAEMVMYADKKGCFQSSGWNHPFLDAYISDYCLDRIFDVLTKDEIRYIKELQKDWRIAMREIEKIRTERYLNGRITREDIERICDYDIKNKKDDFWKNEAIKHKKRCLDSFDRGCDPVDVAVISRNYENGYTTEVTVYTDGTLHVSQYADY